MPFTMHLTTKPRGAPLNTANDMLALLLRLQELEQSMKRPGGARVTDERELMAVRLSLQAMADLNAADKGMHALRCSLADFAPLNIRGGTEDFRTEAGKATSHSG
jgi:hypothetical protein